MLQESSLREIAHMSIIIDQQDQLESSQHRYIQSNLTGNPPETLKRQ